VPTANSRLLQLGFLAEFKDGFVLGKFVFNGKNSHLYSPTATSAKTLAVSLKTERRK
jgi:hypothetical protein